MSTAEQLDPETGHPSSCGCTACTLTRQLDATPKGYTAPEQRTDVSAAIAELAALRGVDLPAGTVHRCECGAEVASRGDTCAPCTTANSAELRRMVLAKAWRSLPAWPWAEIGPKCPAHRDLLEAVATWGRDVGHMLLLGRTGVGKSTAAIAGAKRILRRAEGQALSADEMTFAVGLRFVEARNLIADVRAHGGFGGKTEPPLFALAARATLLILDEVGFEPADAHNDPIPRLLERRYNAPSRRTWITSGLTSKEFAQRYGAAIGRKMGIEEPERGRVVEVFG